MSSHTLTRATRAAGAAAFALLLAAQSAAASGPVLSTARATTSNPYAGCTIGSGPPEWETVNYPGAEVEPMIAVNPTDKRNIIGVVQQDRWNDGGAHGLVAMVSHNGGASFNVVALPFTSCAPGGLPYERASDPWVSFGPDGTAYTVSISFDENTTRGNVAVATSTDGGNTWGNVREIITDTEFFNDKESVTADPTTPGTAYVVWDRPPYCCSFPGPSWISKTTDFGNTWSAPHPITAANDRHGDIGNVVVIDPRNGTMYDIVNRFFDYNRSGKYVALKSTDDGTTWSAPANIALDKSILTYDPHPGGKPIRTGDTLPSAAIDPHTGRLYVVWEDARFTGGMLSQILMSTSLDGVHWSNPSVVSTVTGQAAFVPSVAVNDAGQVAVTYYDFRAYDPARDRLPTGYFMRVSPAGGTAFGPDIDLLGGTFNMATAPDAGGLFLGDYEGLAARGNLFFSIYCKTTGNVNHTTNCFVAKVKL